MKRSRSAFTLIECVLALGIAATVLVALVGLLPAGLDATRTAALGSAEAAIIERLRQQIESGTPPGDFYFDAQGAPVSDGPADAVFAARVEASSALALPGETTGAMRSTRILLSDRVSSDSFGDDRRLHAYRLLLAAPEGAPP
jgi:uncharacterized protein (TIGR02598 family)